MLASVRRVEWRFSEPFVIASHARTHATALELELVDGAFVGRAEAAGVANRGETLDSLAADLHRLASTLDRSLPRKDLQNLLPPGGARNALDCAMWDLEAKSAERPAWQLAGLQPPKPVLTACTIGLGAPVVMAEAARSRSIYPLLKLKLGGTEEDLARVEAVRRARPDSRLIVDANQSWSEVELRLFVPVLARLGVELIEQPLPVDSDEMLLSFESPIPLCADESCLSEASLPGLIGKYHFVNIKLDKSGGLTHALDLCRAARGAGFQVMTGCMAGSSLAMAPAFLVAQLSDLVDLDTPILLAEDRSEPIIYDGPWMQPPPAGLWG